MKLYQVDELHKGDQVYWSDPDDGLCSRMLTINTITVRQDGTVCITEDDGSVLECLPEELS